jgi:hypothetical protein
MWCGKIGKHTKMRSVAEINEPVFEPEVLKSRPPIRRKGI